MSIPRPPFAPLALPDTPVCNGYYWYLTFPQNYTSPNRLDSVSALSQVDVWAVGLSDKANPSGQALIQHWDGSNWNVVPANAPAPFSTLQSVTAISPADVWTAGYYYNPGPPAQTLVEHWNGSSWQQIASANPSSSENLLFGIAHTPNLTDTWAVGGYAADTTRESTLVEHCTAITCTKVTSQNGTRAYNLLHAVTMVSANEGWAVGITADNQYHHYAQPLILHYTGGTWAATTLTDTDTELHGVDYFTANNVWAVGTHYYGYNNASTYIIHWDGQSWQRVSSPDVCSTANSLASVFVTPAGDAWTVGSCLVDNTNTRNGTDSLYPYSFPLVLHWNGRAWQSVQVPSMGSPAQGAFNDLYGVSSSLTSVWAVGSYQSTFNSGELTLAASYVAPTPPSYTHSYYEQRTDISEHYAQGYCAAKGGESGVVILDYGYPVTTTTGYGTFIFNKTVTSTQAISLAVRAYTDGFDDGYRNRPSKVVCISPPPFGSTGITLAIGTSNYTVAGATYPAAALTTSHAIAWASVVSDANTYIGVRGYTEIYEVDAAIDAEPNWEITPTVGISTGAEIWARGFSSRSSYKLFNYGSTDGYPCLPNPPIPNPHTCSLWSQEYEGPERIYTMSWGIPRSYAIPQDYLHEWNRDWYLVKRWAKDQHNVNMSFSGTTSNCLNDPCILKGGVIGQSLYPAWQSFWLEINADPVVQLLTNSTYIH